MPGIFKRALLDLFFPPRCEVCGTLGSTTLCELCQQEVLQLDPPYCALCGLPLPPATRVVQRCGECRQTRRYFDGARCVGVHSGVLRQAILAYKFENRQTMAEPLAAMMARRFYREAQLPEALPFAAVEALVPVPLHPSRRRWRGFDQAQRLTRELGIQTGLPVWDHALQRTRPTLPQVELTLPQRQFNVRDAFAGDRELLAGCRILLVDDVLTTGSTCDQAARAAKAAGATAVYVLVLSRPAPDWHPANLVLEPGEV